MATFNQFKYTRTSSLIALNNIDKNVWDIQPTGYPNTVRWNAGHVYVTAEEFLNKADHKYEMVHPEWIELFIDGTRPSEWGDNVPKMAEIMEALEEQEGRILRFFADKLANKSDETQTFHALSMDTVDAVMQFLIWHEGIHLGIIKSLKLAIQNEQ